jgi:hypothetical protein
MMSNINLYEAYQRKIRKFGMSSSSANFKDSFVDAVNLVYSELNEKVFESNALEPIESFDSIIDNRLANLTTMTFDSDANTAMEGREFWAVEYEFERTSDTNTFTDTITVAPDDVVMSITNGVASIVGSTVSASFTLPDVSIFTLRFESSPEGVKASVNGDIYGMTYTDGDANTTQAIGTATAHVISAVTGYEFKRTRFFTEGTLLYEFLLNEGGALTTVVDLIGAYTATLLAPDWKIRYIEPSTSLDFRYRAPFEMGLDFHLQDGGQWALEPEAERERKWYGRGIRSARSTFQQLTPYINPLGI